MDQRGKVSIEKMEQWKKVSIEKMANRPEVVYFDAYGVTGVLEGSVKNTIYFEGPGNRQCVRGKIIKVLVDNIDDPLDDYLREIGVK